MHTSRMTSLVTVYVSHRNGLAFYSEFAATADDLELYATSTFRVVTAAQVGHRLDAPLVDIHVTRCNTANITSQLNYVNLTSNLRLCERVPEHVAKFYSQ